MKVGKDEFGKFGKPYHRKLWRYGLSYSEDTGREAKRLRLLNMGVTLGLLLSPFGLIDRANAAGTITRVNSTTNLMQNGMAKIHPEVIDTATKTGLNRFQQFQVGAGEIANLYLYDAGKTQSVNTLVNAVNSKIDVQGTVNAIRSSDAIGGNLIFLSSSGMVVGAQGAINAGSLNVQATTADAFSKAYINATTTKDLFGSAQATTEANLQSFLNYNSAALLKGQIMQGDKQVTIPLNGTGTIEVQGNINAAIGIMLKASQVQLAKDSEGKGEAKLRTGVDFSAVSNVGTKEQTAINDTYYNAHKLTASKDASGNIILTDASDSANLLTGDGSVILEASTDELNGSSAEKNNNSTSEKIVKTTVGTGSTIAATGNITIGASTNLTKENKSAEKKVIANTQSTTSVAGTLTSVEGNITISADAILTVTNENNKKVEASNAATVTVGKGAALTASNVKITGTATTSITGSQTKDEESGEKKTPQVFIQGSNNVIVQVDDNVELKATKAAQISATNTTNIISKSGLVPSDGLGTDVVIFDIVSKAQVKNLDSGDTTAAATWQANSFDITATSGGKILGLSVSGHKTSTDSSSNSSSQSTFTADSSGEGDRFGDDFKIRNKTKNEDGSISYTEQELGEIYINSSGKQTAPTTDTNGSNGPKLATAASSSSTSSEQGSCIGVNYAGSVLWHDLNYQTVAQVENVTLDLKSEDLTANPTQVKVAATDNTFLMGLGGALAWTRENSSGGATYKVTLAGDVAVNDVTKNTSSLITNATIKNAMQVDNSARNEGTQIAAAVAAGMETGSRSKVTYANIMATGSVNLIASNVTAKITGSKINEGSSGGILNNTAYDKDLQVAGGVSAEYAQSYANVGASVAINRVTNKIEATIDGSKVGSTADKAMASVTNLALSNLTQVGAALSAGIVPQSSTSAYVTINGAAAANTLNNDIKSTVSGSTVYTSTIDVEARDGKLTQAETENQFIAEINATKTGEGWQTKKVFDITASEITGSVNTNNVATTVDSEGNIAQTTDEMVDYSASEATYTGTTSKVEDAGNVIVGAALNFVLNMQSGASGEGTGGASVVYNKIDNDFRSTIDNSTIVTTSAGSSASPAVNVVADSSTLLVGAAAGIAIQTAGSSSTFSAEVAGSVVIQKTYNDTIATIGGGSNITSDYTKLSATNKDSLVSVGGLAGVTVGNLGLGMTWSQNILDNTTGAYVSDATFTALTSGAGADLAAIATNDSSSLSIAVGLGVTATTGSKTVTVAAYGAYATTDGSSDTEAVIDKAKIAKAKKVEAKASDRSDTKDIAGTISVATGSSKVGVAAGGAVVNNLIGKSSPQKVLAQINNSTIGTDSASTLTAEALNEAQMLAIAAGGAVSAGSGTVQVSVQGSVANTDIATLTDASMTNNTITQNTGAAALTVHSKSKTKLLSTADSLSVATGSGTVSLAAMGAVSVVDSDADTTASISGGDYTVGATSLTAESENILTDVVAGVTVGIAGSSSGIVAAGSVAINNIDNNTKTEISGATIKAATLTDKAKSYENMHSYGGALSAGVSSIGGVALGGTVVLNTITGDTLAKVTNSTIDSTGLFSVEADATHKMDDISVTGGVGASGTGAIGIDATAVLNNFAGVTEAVVEDTDINKNTSTPLEGQDVTVQAKDASDIKSKIGTISVAGSASLSVAAAASVDTNNFARTTRAAIVGKAAKEHNIVNGDKVKVDADSDVVIQLSESGLGIGGSAKLGISAVGAASVDTFAATTEAKVANITGKQEDLSIRADSAKAITAYTKAASISGGFLSVFLTASVVVAEDTSTTIAGLYDSNITKATSRSGGVTVEATNTDKFASEIAQGGIAIGLGGAAGATVLKADVNNRVATYVTNSKVNTEDATYKYDFFTAQANNNVDDDFLSVTVSGGLTGIGVGVNVANFYSGAVTNIAGSTIYADKITVGANEDRHINVKMDAGTIGAVSIGVNVNLINVGTALQDVYSDPSSENATYDTQEIEDKVKEAKQQAKDANNSIAAKSYAQGHVAEDTREIVFKRGGTAEGVQTLVNGSTLTATDGTVAIKSNGNTDLTSKIGELSVAGVAVNVAISKIDTVNKNGVELKDSAIYAKDITVDSLATGTTSNELYQAGIGGGDVNVKVAKVNRSGENTLKIDKAILKAANSLAVTAKDTTTVENVGKGISVGGIASIVDVIRVTDKSNDLITITNGSSLAAYSESVAQEKLKIEDKRTTYIKDANGNTLRKIVRDNETVTIYDGAGKDITSSESSRITTSGSEKYYSADYTKETMGTVSVGAQNAVNATNTLDVGSAGALAINVLVATAEAGKDGTGISQVEVTGENTFKAGTISLTASNKQSVTSEQKAVTAGAIAVGVLEETATNEGAAKLKVSDGQTVVAEELNLTAQAARLTSDTYNAYAYLESVTAAVDSVAVNIAKVNSAMTVGLDLGAVDYRKATLSRTSREDILNKFTQTVTGVNYTLIHMAEVEGGTTVNANAHTGTALKSYVTGVTSGLVASGTNEAKSVNNNTVTVNIKAGEANAMEALNLNASNNDQVTNYANGDGGGLVAISPYAAYAEHKNASSTTVNLAGTFILTGDFTVDVVNSLTQDMQATALQATVVGGSGVQVKNTVDNKATLNVENATIATTGNIALGTDNKVTFNSSDKYALEASDYGICEVSVVELNNTITTTSTTNVGANTNITTEKGQKYWAKTDNNVKSNLYLLGLGGAVGVDLGYNKLTLTANDKVTLAEGSSLKNSKGEKDVVLAAVDNQSIHTGNLAETSYGLIGASSADTKNTIKRYNDVEVSGDILSYNDVKLLAGEDADESYGFMYLKSEAEAYNKTVIPVCTAPKLTNTFSQHNRVNVTEKGYVRAIHDAHIYADAGRETTDTFCGTYTLWASDASSTYASTTNGTVNVEGGSEICGKTVDNYFTCDGYVMAGLANELNVTVGDADKNLVVVLDDTSYERVKAATTDVSNVVILLSDAEYEKRKSAGTLKADYPYKHYSEFIHIEDNGQKDIYDLIGLKADDFTTRVVDYAASNYERLEELSLLMTDNSENKNSAVYLGYQSEYDRIKADLTSMGLLDSEGKLTGSLLINALIVPDLKSSGGNTYIQTPKYNDEPTAKEHLVVKGTPEIKLNNYTSLATVLKDVTMQDPGGEIYHNSVLVYSEGGAGGSAGSITITGWNTTSSINYKDDAGNIKTESVLADIYILGTVSNAKGDVTITSINNSIAIAGDSVDADGNTITGGSVTGKTVTLSAAKSVSQGFVDGIVHTTTDVQTQYDATYQDYINKHTSEGDSKTEVGKYSLEVVTPSDKSKAASGGYIAGESIYISATNVNINGLVQSGFDKYYVDYDVDTTYINGQGDIVDSSTSGAKTIATRMKELEEAYAGVALSDKSVLGNPNYMLTSGGSVYNASADKGYYEREVATYYNPFTQKILVRDVNKTAGEINITGQISSTGNGKLICLDGSYNIDVQVADNAKHTVVVGQLITNDAAGKITLKDTATQKIYEYTRNHETGKIATTISNLDGTNPQVEAEADSVSFQPLSGLRYNWSTGYNTTMKDTYRETWKNNWWGAGSTSDYSKKLIDSSTDTNKISSDDTVSTMAKRNGAYIGKVTQSGMESADGFDIIWNHVKTSETVVTVTTTREWNEGYLNSNHYTEVTWTEEKGYTDSYMGSVKADNPVSIKFIGDQTSASTVKVQNSGNVEVTGVVGNSQLYTPSAESNVERGTVQLTSQSGDVKQLGGGIYGEKVALTAAGSIKDVVITAGDKVELSATLSGTNVTGDSTHIVGVTVEGNKGARGDVLVAGLGSSNASQVYLDATGSRGDITEKDGTGITGRRIDLATTYGSITVMVNVGQTPLGSDTLTASLNASSRGNITIEQIAGDLRVGTVVSASGDVELKVPNGSVVDALPYGSLNLDSEDNLVTKWLSSGLVKSKEGDSEEAKAATEAMRQRKQAAMDKAAAQQKKDKATYTQVDREVLLYTIQDSIINQSSSDLPKTSTKNPNIQGNNITLLVKDSAGLMRSTQKFTTNDIGTDTDEHLSNLKALSRADASTVTWVTKDGVGYITIQEQLPIGIQTNVATGTVSVGNYTNVENNAAGNVFLQGRVEKLTDGSTANNANTDFTIGSVHADKDVSITSLGNIYYGGDADSKGVIAKNFNITALGTIGTAEKMLTTALLECNTLRAVSASGIYLNDIGTQTIAVKAMSTAGNIDLRANGSIISYNETGASSQDAVGEIVVEQNGAITLTSRTGNIGVAATEEDEEGLPAFSGKGIRIRNNKGQVTLNANKSVYVEGRTTDTSSARQPQGEINIAVNHVDATGASDSGKLTEVEIYANGGINLVGSGFVTTNLISLDAETALSVNSSLTSDNVKLRSRQSDLSLASGTVTATTAVKLLATKGNISETYDNAQGVGAAVVTANLTAKAGQQVDLGSKLNALQIVHVDANNTVTVGTNGANHMAIGVTNSSRGDEEVQGDVTIHSYGDGTVQKAVLFYSDVEGKTVKELKATGNVTALNDSGAILVYDDMTVDEQINLFTTKGNIINGGDMKAGENITFTAESAGDNTLLKDVTPQGATKLEQFVQELHDNVLATYVVDSPEPYAFGNIINHAYKNSAPSDLSVGVKHNSTKVSIEAQSGIAFTADHSAINGSNMLTDTGDIAIKAGVATVEAAPAGLSNILNKGNMVVSTEGAITLSNAGHGNVINYGVMLTQAGNISATATDGAIQNGNEGTAPLILTGKGDILLRSEKGDIENYGNSFALGYTLGYDGTLTIEAVNGNIANKTDLNFNGYTYTGDNENIKAIVDKVNATHMRVEVAGGDIKMLANQGKISNEHATRSFKNNVMLSALTGLENLGEILAEKDITLYSDRGEVYNRNVLASSNGNVNITAAGGGIINTRTTQSGVGRENGGNIVALNGKVILKAQGVGTGAQLSENGLTGRSGSILNAGDILALGDNSAIELTSLHGDVLNSDDFTNISDKDGKSLGTIYTAIEETLSVKKGQKFDISTCDITFTAEEGKIYTTKDLYSIQGNIALTAKEGLSNYAYKLFANKNITLRATEGDVLNTSELESNSGDITLTADKGSVLNLQGADIVTLGGDVTLTSGAEGDGNLYYIDINASTKRQEIKTIENVASCNVQRYYRTSPTGEWLEISTIMPTPEQTSTTQVKTVITYSLKSAPETMLTKELNFDSTAYRNGSVVNYGDIIASNKNAAGDAAKGSIRLISEKSNVDNFDDFNKYATAKSEIYQTKKAYGTIAAGKSYDIATGNIELSAAEGHIYNSKKLLVADGAVSFKAGEGMDSFGEKIYAGGDITLHATQGLLANNAELVSVEGDITLCSDDGAVVNMIEGDLIAMRGMVTLNANIQDPTANQTLRYVDITGHKGTIKLNGEVPEKNVIFIVDKYYIPDGSTEYKRVDATVDINNLTTSEQGTLHSVFSYIDDEGDPHYTYDPSQIYFTGDAGTQLAQETITFTDKWGDKVEKAVALKGYVEAYRDGDVVNSGDIAALNMGGSETVTAGIVLRSELSNTMNFDNYLVVDGKYDDKGNAIYNYDGTKYFNAKDRYSTNQPGIQIGSGTVEHLAENGYLLNTEDIVTKENYDAISKENIVWGKTSGKIVAGGDILLKSHEGFVRVGVDLTAGESVQLNAANGIKIASTDEQIKVLASNGQVKLVTEQGDVYSTETIEAHAKDEDDDLLNGSVNVSSVYGSVNMAEILADKSASVGVSGAGAERATITIGSIKGKQVVLMNDDVRTAADASILSATTNDTGTDANIKVSKLSVYDGLVLRGETMDLCPIERTSPLNETLSIIAVGANNGTIKGEVDFLVSGNTRFHALNVTDTDVNITEGGKLGIDRMNVSGAGYFHSQGYNTSAYGKKNPYMDTNPAIYFDQGIYGRAGKSITAVDPEKLFFDTSTNYVPFDEMGAALEDQRRAYETSQRGDNTWMNLYVDSGNFQRSNGLLLHLSNQYYSANQRYSMEDFSTYVLNDKALTIFNTQYGTPIVEFERFDIIQHPQDLWGAMAEVPMRGEGSGLRVEENEGRRGLRVEG